MSPLLQLALAAVVIGAIVAFFFWKARGVKPDQNADRDTWKRPDQGGGMEGGD